MATDPNITRIKFLRSKTANAKPLAADIDEGELAFNLTDRTIFSKSGTNVVELGFGKGGTVAGEINQTVGGITSTGTITAPTFSGALSGNATTATRLQTARTISLSGSARGSISFDGTSNQSISVNVNAVDALAIYTKSNSDSPTNWAQGVQSVFVSSTQGWPMPYGGVITARPYVNGGGTLQILTAYGSTSGVGGGEIKIRTGDYSGTGNDTWTSWKTLVHSENVNDYSPTKTGVGASGTWGIAVTGNAATATALQTARTIGGVSFNGTANINLPGVNTAGNQSTTGSAASLTTARSFSWTGDATGSLSFDGSANVSAVLTLANSGVTAGTYKSVTVDAKGRVTGGNDVVTGLVTSTAATGTTNAATSNTNTYLNIVETIGSSATTVGTSTQVTGAGTVTVTSDTAGKLTITGSQNITGNAATATSLQTARTINGVAFNGTVNITIADSTKLPLTGGTVTGVINAPALGVNNNVPTTGAGISLYATATTGQPSYGLMFAGTPTFGAHGDVTGDWATYFTMTGVTTRGWIFKHGTGATGNVASISSTGVITASTFVGSLTGNAASATKLQTSRTIGITGSGASGSISFDGTGNVNIPLDIATQPTTTNNTTIATTAFVQAVNAADTGSAATALALKTARTINGTSFNGSANITTANWGTARNFTIGNTAKSVDGSGNVAWSLAEIGALPTAGGTMTGPLTNNRINLNSFDNNGSGILWYSTSSNTWQDYMASAGSTGNGYSQTITAPTGVLVTGSGRRSLISDVTGYGWTFEVGTFDTTAPTIVAEISSTGESRWSGAMTVVGNITATGNITAFSDARLKDNITKIPDALNKLNLLKGVTYTRKDIASDKKYAGLIAQDVQKVLPEAVATTEGDIIAVDYNGVIGLLVEAVKELSDRIEMLEG